jgi:RNA polymerase sigma-70 factor (ECF subfamily)
MREQILTGSAGVGVNDPELVIAISELPLEQREVIVLRHVLGFGTGEIAKILKVPRGTVGSRLRRGLNELEDNYRRSA